VLVWLDRRALSPVSASAVTALLLISHARWGRPQAQGHGPEGGFGVKETRAAVRGNKEPVPGF